MRAGRYSNVGTDVTDAVSIFAGAGGRVPLLAGPAVGPSERASYCSQRHQILVEFPFLAIVALYPGRRYRLRKSATD